VLQLEALAQAGAIAVLSDARYAGKLPLFGGVEDVRFRRIVRPGDEITLDVELERLSARGGWGRGRASVNGEECCRARLLFAIA
jgi:3-hydroxyacyl-[acyl-carrier-protein] dehydratase